MTLLQDLIAAQTALVPVVDRVAPDALGYGTDLSCVLDVTPDLDEVDPMSTVAIGEAIVRRFITPRGGVVDDQSYGLDLRGYCNRGVTNEQIVRLQSQCRVEALKDDRVSDAEVSIRWVAAERRLSVRINATAVDSAQEFSLTFFVTADGLLLQESIGAHG